MTELKGKIEKLVAIAVKEEGTGVINKKGILTKDATSILRTTQGALEIQEDPGLTSK